MSQSLGMAGPLARWAPLAALAAAIAGAYALGLDEQVSLESLAAHHAAIRAFVVEHAALAVLSYIAVYVAAVGLSFPVAAVLSIAGGLLFGWALGAAAAVVAATIGATLIFAIVRTSLGSLVAAKAGPAAARLSREFEKDAFSYLLFLRLVPAFPFLAVNVAAGLTHIPLRIFVFATFIGIIPGAFAFAYLGTGLDSLIAAQAQSHRDCIATKGSEACSFDLNPSALITPDIVIALTALGAVALLPVLVKRWKARKR